jgi:glycosyltransferase involved in cell wall biosynthesis
MTVSKTNIYLDRYAYPEQLIATQPNVDLKVVVTIPCYNEPDLIGSLASLYQCQLPMNSTEVIVVINHSTAAAQSIKDQNQRTYDEAIAWTRTHNNEQLQFHIFLKELPHKHAGVGLARKIAMDEAARRFETIDTPEGVIACFDADSLCEENYLLEVVNHFEQHSKSSGCAIHFEHPLLGNLNKDIYQAITEYELFLRYYTHAQLYCGLPYAYQTIGSSMAVRSAAYQKQGGMNRRKAGEDFYFLHKIIALGHFTELKTTKVIPSPRQSDRVPFGTGKAVNKWLEEKSLTTYSPQTFVDLKAFTDQVEQLWLITDADLVTLLEDLPSCIQSFLVNNRFANSLTSIKNNSATQATFTDRFYRWFDAFKLLKYVHYARDHYHANIPILKASEWLLNAYHGTEATSEQIALLMFRELDRR